MTPIDLRTDYLGLELRSPLMASSSPLTGDLDGLKRLEDAGVGAVVLPSLFEEEIEREARETGGMLETGAGTSGQALGYFSELEDYDIGPDRYLELVRRASETLDVPVTGSLNGTTPGGWVEYAREIEEAGASALELNLYGVAADPNDSAETIERNYCALVKQMKATVRIPLAVKIGPFFTALAHTAAQLTAAGADGLVLFNRFYQPDLDLEDLEVAPRLTLSTSEELRLPLRWIALLHGRVDTSLAATSGVHTAEDALKALLAGANVAMLASALLSRGARELSRIERGILEWMDEHGCESVRQLVGSVSQRAIADPTACERGNYVKTLRSFSSDIPA